jgi:hypothetical protein
MAATQSMRNPMIRPALCAVLCLMAFEAVAQESPAPPKSPAPPDLKSTPWHLVDIWWDVGRESPFESYSIDVEISDDVPATKNLYISPVGLGHLSKTPFYGGIQSQSDGRTKQDSRLRKIGPGFIFSMWGQRSLDAIRPSAGGICESSGNEGDFVSVRRPYEWKKGKFTYKIAKMDKEEVDGQPMTWVAAFVYSHEKDENVFIGALRFKGENLVLDRKVASFVEIYGRPIPLTEIPKVTVTLGNLKVNGKAVTVASADAIYPKRIPDYAEVTARNGALVVQVGKPVEDRKQRKVRVIGE